MPTKFTNKLVRPPRKRGIKLIDAIVPVRAIRSDELFIPRPIQKNALKSGDATPITSPNEQRINQMPERYHM